MKFSFLGFILLSVLLSSCASVRRSMDGRSGRRCNIRSANWSGIVTKGTKKSSDNGIAYRRAFEGLGRLPSSTKNLKKGTRGQEKSSFLISEILIRPTEVPDMMQRTFLYENNK